MPRKVDEPVRLTRIYTGGGDRGETSLGDGSRVSKLDCRIAAFGTVDELNSLLGVVLAGELPGELRPVLERVQNELFDVGADISVPFGVGDGRLRVSEAQISALEHGVRPLQRRASRAEELRAAGRDGDGGPHARRSRGVPTGRAGGAGCGAGAGAEPAVLVYLNRLSDLLFILARAANAADGRDEPLWKPGDSR